MMSAFLSDNRVGLIERCRVKVGRRPGRQTTAEQLAHGIPIFLDQLERTLRAEEEGEDLESLKISGEAGGEASELSEMGVSATAHGRELLGLGFTIDQVVHDYGDLCQAITDLAVELEAPFGVPEFRTLNRCLDNAIAGAVAEFSMLRDADLARTQSDAFNERMGLLVHELRNALLTASLAVAALEQSQLSVSGATGGVLKRSIASMKRLIGAAMDEVRQAAPGGPQTFVLSEFIAEAVETARLYAEQKSAQFQVEQVDTRIQIKGNRPLLIAALGNILQNAFKFTQTGTLVTLRVRLNETEVELDVADHCGGLPRNDGETLFSPFSQGGRDRSGLGLGLTLARRTVEADGGKLLVRNLPGIGCVFTIRLPLVM
jgi:signal transduction histidine kinase